MLKFPSTIPPARPPAALGAADRLLGLWTHSPGRVSGYEGGVAVPPRGQGGAGMRSQWPGVHQLDMADMAQKSVGLKITPMAPGQFWQFFVKGPGLFNLEYRGSYQLKIGGPFASSPQWRRNLWTWLVTSPLHAAQATKNSYCSWASVCASYEADLSGSKRLRRGVPVVTQGWHEVAFHNSSWHIMTPRVLAPQNAFNSSKKGVSTLPSGITCQGILAGYKPWFVSWHGHPLLRLGCWCIVGMAVAAVMRRSGVWFWILVCCKGMSMTVWHDSR